MSDSNSFRALRDARPAGDGLDPHAMRDRIVGSDPAAGDVTRPSRRRSRAVQLSLVGVAATALVAASFAFAPPSPTGAPAVVPGVTTAYAAVHQAVTKTFASTESGTIVTRTDAHWADGRGEIGLRTTVAWNGDDVSLKVGVKGEQGGDCVYVDDRFYERNGDGLWVHHAESDKDLDPSVGPAWVAAARRDVDGDRIAQVIDVLEDLGREPQKDGSTIYIGHATAKAIAGEYKDTAGLPYISRPFPKLGDEDTSVKVAITVGADGIVRSWTAAYSWDGADWVYTAEYKDLGSTKPITAPNPSQVVEGDGTRG